MTAKVYYPPFEEFRAACERLGLKIKDDKGNHFHVESPLRPGENPSLHVTKGNNGKALLTDFGAVGDRDEANAQILELLGFIQNAGSNGTSYVNRTEQKRQLERWAERLTAASEREGENTPPTPPKKVYQFNYCFSYCDESGTLLYQIRRSGDGPNKSFLTYHPNGNGEMVKGQGDAPSVLYHLPDLLTADPTFPVYIPEGEKHVDFLRSLGFVATCNPFGAEKWKPEYNQHLAGRYVCILPDNDVKGKAHALKVAQNLYGIAAEIRMVELPGLGPKGDVIDWIEAGHTPAELQQLAEAAPVWTPIIEPVSSDHTDPEDDEGETEPLDMPLLPGIEPVTEYDPDAGRWLTDFVEFATQASTMTPQIYLEALGLWCLSAAIARRVKVSVSTGPIYPNLFILLVGPPGLVKKSSAMWQVERVARAAGIFLLPGQMTPEALGIELSMYPPQGIQKDPAEYNLWKEERRLAGQRSWLLDEASGLFEATKRDYMAALKPTILRWYDCPAELSFTMTVSRGRVKVKNAYTAFAGFTTPGAMAQYFAKNSVEWQDGTWSRFNLITHEKLPEFQFFGDDIQPSDSLISRLRNLFSGVLPLPDLREEEVRDVEGKVTGVQMEVDALQEQIVHIDYDVWQAWEAYARATHTYAAEAIEHGDERLSGIYTRLHTHAIKIATLLAAADWSDWGGQGPIFLALNHWQRAQWISERWRASFHRLDKRLTKAITEGEGRNEFKALSIVGKIKEFIAKKGGQATLRELTQRFHKSQGFEAALKWLLDNNQVEVDDNKIYKLKI